MAAKINRHRYGTKLRHCRPLYNPNLTVNTNLTTLNSNPNQNADVRVIISWGEQIFWTQMPGHCRRVIALGGLW